MLAHPFRFGTGVKKKVVRSLNVAAEGINGRSWQGDNLRATALGRQLGKPLTGGSDAHILFEVGRAWTLFPLGIERVEDALKALGQGKVMPGGKGLSLGRLIHSKALGTRRWLARQIGKKGTGDPRGREGR